MPEGDRSEAPTARRLQDLRQKGEVVRSNEFNVAVALLTGTVALRLIVPGVVEQIEMLLRSTLLSPTRTPLDVDSARFFAIDVLMRAMTPMAPLFLAIVIAAVLSNLIQVGPLATPSAVAPKFSRMDPIAGFKRIFSLSGFVELGKAGLKLIVIAAVIYHTLSGQMDTMLMLARRDAFGGVAWLTELASDVMLRVGVVFLLLAGADYLFQRWQYMRRARMTKEEVKEELRSTEGSPEMRNRLRNYARSVAMSRMMLDVPTADVVITNPTHIAIALKYDVGTQAPRVIAKGERLIAERIKQIARTANIPIIENKPLAQALFRAVEVGDEIPSAFYQVVAEVLAFVYRLRVPRLRPA